MSRRRSSVAASIVAAALLLCLSGPAGSQGRKSYEVEKVFVVNLPATQQVTGAAFVEGPVRHAVLQRFKETLVSPVSPRETMRLVPAGTLVTDGFTSVVLSLNGRALKPGTVGAFLIPDEESVALRSRTRRRPSFRWRSLPRRRGSRASRRVRNGSRSLFRIIGSYFTTRPTGRSA